MVEILRGSMRFVCKPAALPVWGRTDGQDYFKDRAVKANLKGDVTLVYDGAPAVFSLSGKATAASRALPKVARMSC